MNPPPRGTALLGLLSAAAAANLAHALYLWARLEGNDFRRFYEGTAQALAGGSLYAPNAFTGFPIGDSELELLNLNHPPFHVLLLPFLALPPMAAGWLWQALAQLAAILVVVRVGETLGWTWLRRGQALALLLLSHAWWAQTATGQVGGGLMLLGWLAWRAQRQGAWSSLGSFLALIAFLKPPLGLLLGWACWRQPATLRGIGLPLPWLLGGTLMWGLSAWSEWYASVSALDWGWLWMNGSLSGAAQRLLVSGPAHRAALELPSALPGVSLLLVGAVSLCSALGLRRPRPLGDQLLLVGLAAQLVSPLGWAYYLPTLFPFAAEWWCRARPGVACWLALGLGMAPLWVVGLTDVGGPWRPWVGSLATTATVTAWAAVALRWDGR